MAKPSLDFTTAPIHLLFYSPMRAALDAQKLMARNMISYINEMAYGEREDDTQAQSGTDNKTPTRRKVQTLDMQLEKPITRSNGTIAVQKITVKPPILGLVPIQSLLIDEVTVSFSLGIESHTTMDDNTTTETNTSDTQAKLTTMGKVTAQRENTRKTDNTGKYDVSMTAKQQGVSEGMSKLLELLASCVEPIQLEVSTE